MSAAFLNICFEWGYMFTKNKTPVILAHFLLFMNLLLSLFDHFLNFHERPMHSVLFFQHKLSIQPDLTIIE